MPQVIEPIPFTRDPTPHRKRWTRQECEFLQNNGLLTGRYELVDGEILSKMGQKPPHRTAVVLLRDWMIAIFGRGVVLSQNPIDVGDADPDENEPEPDVAVAAQPVVSYADRHPGPDDLLIVGEVSDSTLRFDLNTKAQLYSRAGIEEYWVVDIAGRQVYVHREPSPGGYNSMTAYREDESVTTLARPEASVLVADLLPPQSQ